MPLTAYEKEDDYKIYLSNIGLLTFMYGSILLKKHYIRTNILYMLKLYYF